MTASDQITLYSCHLCGFCETSLSALTKHTASHIKSENPNEQARSSVNGSLGLMQKDAQNMNDFEAGDNYDDNGECLH